MVEYEDAQYLMIEEELKPGAKIWFGRRHKLVRQPIRRSRYFSTADFRVRDNYDASPILWTVLCVDKKNMRMLMLADDPVRFIDGSYHDGFSWDTCKIRDWLKREFYEQSFSLDEKNAFHLISNSTINYVTKGGEKNTTVNDNLFLLTDSEVQKYLKKEERIIRNEFYNEYWMLRSSSGERSLHCVKSNGMIDKDFTYWSRKNRNPIVAIRPAVWVNLNADFFGNRMIRSSDRKMRIRIPAFIIQKGVLVDYLPGSSLEIPEGVVSIADHCFTGDRELTEVELPSTLEEIGLRAFAGCVNLQKVSCLSNKVSYGTEAFGCNARAIYDPELYSWDTCEKLEYTPEMYHTTGKLCSSFYDHCSVCGPEELAWVVLSHKGEIRNKIIETCLNRGNASAALSIIADLIEKDRVPKKLASKAEEYITTNISLLEPDSILRFLAVLRIKKMNAMAAVLAENPLIAEKCSGDRNHFSDECVLADGSILTGRVEKRFEAGNRIFLAGIFWRVLEIDEDRRSMLLLAEQSVALREFHSSNKNVKWGNSSLRSWLNGEYYDRNFTQDEKKAVLETALDHYESGKMKDAGIKDRVFLLNKDEAKNYFNNDDERRFSGGWWLRTRAPYNCIMTVSSSGYISTYGDDVGVDHKNHVRPVIRVDLDSDCIKKYLVKEENGEIRSCSPAAVIRAGVLTSVNQDAEEIILPSYVKGIRSGAISCCKKLKKLEWTGRKPTIERDAFEKCPELQLPAEVYLGSTLPNWDLLDYMPDTPAVLANVLRCTESERWLQRAFPKINDTNALPVIDHLLQYQPDIIKVPENLIRLAFACAPKMGDERLNGVIDTVLRAGFLGDFWVKNLQNEARGNRKAFDPVFFEVRFHILNTPDDLLRRIPSLSGLLEFIAPFLKMHFLWDWIVNEHWYRDSKRYQSILERDKNNAKDEYQRLSLLRQKAEQLHYFNDLQIVLKYWKIKGEENGETEWFAPYIAMADQSEMEAFLSEVKKWKNKTKWLDKWAVNNVRRMVLLNDTLPAMLYVDSIGALDRYAFIRDTTVDELRDLTMSDFGLDEKGRISWTMEEHCITAELNEKLGFTLMDEAGKCYKTLPKRGVKPEEYDRISGQFKELKKNVLSVAKGRNDVIFADFLSGRTRKAALWKDTCLKNPVIRRLSGLIVWEQSGHTFTISPEDGRFINAEGRTYRVTDTAIRVAHPIEMKEDDIKAWQRYFNEHDLQQPFEQIWEPVIRKSSIKKGRYDGLTIPLYMLMNKKKHGIEMKDGWLKLKGCEGDCRLVKEHPKWIENEFEIRDFECVQYSRQVNHIVALLDKGTTASKIRKDDTTAAEWFDRFTLAQIMNFIKLADENGAINVKVLLMDHKNSRYPDYDPMDEFSLDW